MRRSCNYYVDFLAGNLKAGSHLSLSRDEVSHGSPMPSRVTKFDKFSTDSPQLNRRSPTGSLSSQDSIVSSDSVFESRSRFDKVQTEYSEHNLLFYNFFLCVFHEAATD